MPSSRWFLAPALAAALGAAGAAPRASAQGGEAAPDRGAQAAQGRRLYAQLCSHCHGIRMVNPGNSSFDLRKFPRDDEARFVRSVARGKNTMPAWGDMLKPEEIEDLWAYVLTGGRP